MRWLCWFFKHKWIDALDDELQVCERCDKLRKKPRLLPLGAYACPYSACNKKWTAPPQLQGKSADGRICWIYQYYNKCSNCNRPILWNRKSNDDPWELPVANQGRPGTDWFWYGHSL